ncbi:MAG: signal peptidase II [Tannerellaceae bacterium]|nr:signal peptidase II [Tannerellaceae bacterium]
MKKRPFLFLLICLVLLDQTIKLIISHSYLDVRTDIIPGLLEFYPVFNNQYSYINHLFQLGWSLWLHLFIIMVGSCLMGVIYLGLRYVSTQRKLLDLSVLFILAGVICWFLTILFWSEGCLDYIYLKPLFVFDLKDIYCNAGLVLWLFHAVKTHVVQKMTISDIYQNAMKMIRHIK